MLNVAYVYLEKEQELKRVMHELEDDEACLDKRPTKMPKRLEDASRPTDNAKSAKVYFLRPLRT